MSALGVCASLAMVPQVDPRPAISLEGQATSAVVTTSSTWGTWRCSTIPTRDMGDQAPALLDR